LFLKPSRFDDRALGLGKLDEDVDEIGMGLFDKAFYLFFVFNAHVHDTIPDGTLGVQKSLEIVLIGSRHRRTLAA
jgi:hypothetical protein